MPNKKISELTEVTSIIGTDVLAIVNGGVTKKIKADNLAAFVDPDATLRTLSADWVGGNAAFTNLVSNSAAYLSGVDLSFLSVSANWDSVYSTVQSNSASWDYQGTDLKDLSGNWESTYTTVNANSASWGSGSGGSYVGDLSANWESTYTTVLANSASWDYQGNDLKSLSSDWVGGNAAFTNLVSNSAAYLSSVDLSFLSVSANWDSVYSSVANASANWDSVYSSVASNSASYATIDFANSKFFALTGGLISGATRINGNVTIFGDLSSTGTQTFANTVFSTTSALSVVHVGSGPAVWIGNNGSGDIASFYDIDQDVEVFHIGGANGTYPNVGVKVSAPNKDFTVNGEISATGDIWTTGRILSGGQELLSLIQPSIDSLYSTVNSNSATAWNYQGTDLKDLSANWESTYTTVNANSGKYENVSTTVQNTSGAWNYSTIVQIFSATGTATWTKPAGAKQVAVECVGGGGGGGRGIQVAAGASVSGGGGGGSGGFTRVLVNAADLTDSTYTVTVGSGGAGGTTGNATSGTPSNVSGSTLGVFVNANGGIFGGVGVSGANSTAGTGGAPAGNPGGAGNITAAGGNGTGQSYAPSSGGAGGGCSTTTPFNGGTSGAAQFILGGTGAGGIASTSGNGGNGAAVTPRAIPSLVINGSGGGGGGASTFAGASGGAGANATGFGCGGGGGGSVSAATGIGGNGGAGAQGFVVITTYF